MNAASPALWPLLHAAPLWLSEVRMVTIRHGSTVAEKLRP
jgi:hypothetical protein